MSKKTLNMARVVLDERRDARSSRNRVHWFTSRRFKIRWREWEIDVLCFGTGNAKENMDVILDIC